MKENNYTLGTLKYFAKLDSPEAYEALCKEKGKFLFDKAVDGGHNDLAKILFNEYHNEFVFSPSNSKWYHFKGHIWEEVDKCFALRERISDNKGAIISHLDEYINETKDYIKKIEKRLIRPTKIKYDDEYNNEYGDENDEKEELEKIEVERCRNKLVVLNKLIKQCKNSAFKTSVMIECQEVFRNEKFVDKLNIDPNLVAFKNGVYDFKNWCFRGGKPEDYLSVSVSIEYKEYRLDDDEVQEIIEFFRKILPDEEVRKYFLDHACQLFIGGNRNKVFLVWTGSGDNGKSITQKLFEKMLGSLAVKISTKLITGEKDKMSQASPSLARTGNGVRWVVMDEPGANEQITTGQLKAITGNDSYYARDLYERGKGLKEIEPLFKLHMLCNTLPNIKNPDAACWKRIRVIPFESKFVDEDKCPKTYKEQIEQKIFPNDSNFNMKIANLLQPFAWFLIHHLKELNGTNVDNPPEKVKLATNNYKQNNNDPAEDFLDEETEQDINGEISDNDMCTRYREWWKISFPNDKLINSNKKSIINLFTKYLGAPVNITYASGVKRNLFKGVSWRKTEYDEKCHNPML